MEMSGTGSVFGWFGFSHATADNKASRANGRNRLTLFMSLSILLLLNDLRETTNHLPTGNEMVSGCRYVVRTGILIVLVFLQIYKKDKTWAVIGCLFFIQLLYFYPNIFFRSGSDI